jgi:acyl-CoA synthetase (NDP forming)
MLRHPGGKSVAAASPSEVAEMAGSLRYPVVLKGIAPDLVHKTEAGAVVTDIRTPEELAVAARNMAESVSRARPESGGAPASLGFLVQKHVRGGREVIIGMLQDPSFGPLVMFGLGGVYVETLRDVVFRVPPLTDLDAEEMIRQIRGYQLLEGVRGEAPIDLKALAEILQRFSQMVQELPQVAEIDINPFMVFPNAREFCAVDARVLLAEEG